MKYFFFLLLIFVVGCKNQDASLVEFEMHCQMVSNEIKPISFSAAFSSDELDNRWDDLQAVSSQFGVKIYRESRLPSTPLFLVDVDKEVLIIYQDSRLTQYKQWKADFGTISSEASTRRLGRLLGYTPQGINKLMMKNSKFRTLESFGVNQQVTHLYYENLNTAKEFYGETLGLNSEEPDVFAISKDAFLHLHAFDEIHPKGQEQSTAIAFLTDQLPEWYAYVQERDVPIKYTYKPREGGPHDGFVAIDPGGYLLEFEEFKQHPENELFLAEMEYSPRVFTNIDSLNFFGSITWTYHNDMLKMQQFYEEVLGFRMVADQGWTKIYQTSSSGYIGLVDERRGMMDYAEEKAVEIEWELGKLNQATEYFSQQRLNWDSTNNLFLGPEKYRYLLR